MATKNLHVPDDLMRRLREVAAQEERPLNTQILRFIRIGLEQYERQQADSGVRRLA